MDHLAAGLSRGSFITAGVSAYLGGVFASFTPCTYPVIPVTAAYIGAASGGGRARGFYLSLVYVLGMALTYTALGTAAALTGSLFGRIQANPWLHLIMANVFILMGLSMLGVFTLPLRTPTAVGRFLAGERGRGPGGAFVVGAASGLVLGPCTVPILAVLLSFAAAKQNVLLSVTLLFAFSLGLGTLLILVGTFAGFVAVLPRSGRWLEGVQKVWGWLMIAAGEYFLIQAGILWG